MNIRKSKTKNGYTYYLCKSYRDIKTKRTTSKIIEKIGTDTDIKKKLKANQTINSWLEAYLRQKNDTECKNSQINVSFNLKTHNKTNKRRLYNIGYLVIKKICQDISLDKILNKVEYEANIKINLFDIVIRMIYNKILNPFDVQNTYNFSEKLIEAPSFSPFQLYKSIGILSSYSTKIQFELFEKQISIACPKTLYFDEQSFIFYSNEFSTENTNIENNRNFMVSYELIMDGNGIPLKYALPKKYSKSQTYNIEEKAVINNLKRTNIVVYNNKQDSYLLNNMTNKFNNISFVKRQNVNQLSNEVKKWIQDSKKWNKLANNKTYDLNIVKENMMSTKTSALNRQKLNNSIFYKSKIIMNKTKDSERDESKLLIVFFSYELQQIQTEERKNKILHIKSSIDNIISNKHKKDAGITDKQLDKYSNLIDTNKGNNNEINNYKFKDEVLSLGSDLDGYSALIVDNTNVDVEEIINIYSSRWQIHEPFENLHKEFTHTPTYVKPEYAINTHFLIGTLTIIVWRLILNRLKHNTYGWDIGNKFNQMNFLEFPGIGWLPTFEFDSLTIKILKEFDLDLNHQFITESKMKSLLQ